MTGSYDASKGYATSLEEPKARLRAPRLLCHTILNLCLQNDTGLCGPRISDGSSSDSSHSGANLCLPSELLSSWWYQADCLHLRDRYEALGHSSFTLRPVPFPLPSPHTNLVGCNKDTTHAKHTQHLQRAPRLLAAGTPPRPLGRTNTRPLPSGSECAHVFHRAGRFAEYQHDFRLGVPLSNSLVLRQFVVLCSTHIGV
jgi:hypothetical protein